MFYRRDNTEMMTDFDGYIEAFLDKVQHLLTKILGD